MEERPRVRINRRPADARQSPRPPLGREYRKLWTAGAISNVGDGIRFAAFPLLAATMTTDPALVGALYSVMTLPWLLFGLQAGAVVDRVDRRRLIGSVNLAQALIVSLLAVAVATGHASLPLLYAVAFLVGSAETLVDTAAQTIVPSVAPRERLQDANGRLASAETAANDFVGALLGATLFAVAASLPFGVDAGLTAVAALVALSLRGRFRGGHVPAQSLRRAIGEGLRFAVREPLLRTLALVVALVAVADSAWFGILVLYNREILGVADPGYGLLLAAGAAGSVTGGLVAPWVSRRIGAAATIGLTIGLGAVAQLGLGLTSSQPVALGMMAASGVAFTSFSVVSVSLRQLVTPDRLLGRVNGAYRLVGYGATALGALLGGLVASQVGLRAPFLLGAPLVLATAIASYLRLRRLPVANGRG